MKYAFGRVSLRSISLAILAPLALMTAPSADAKPKTPPASYNETPKAFVARTEAFDFTRQDVMIPMRDGVKLHTVILIPKDAKNAGILLTRTPYDANSLTKINPSTHLESVLEGYDNAADIIVESGFIRVVQDVRGKYGSQGDYVMNRPLQGGLNPTKVDHATDTYDTIDWLVKNVKESNGKVGIIGISYDGFTPLMALVNPHPALKVAVPMNPMVDGWRGDDWFHNGAFRQQNMSYIYEQVGSHDNSIKWYSGYHDEYDLFMQAGSAGELGKQYGLEQNGFWQKVTQHPAYDAFWQQQAMDKMLAAQPLSVPVMLVHGLWDQEDIYGAQAVYRALEPKDVHNDKVFLVMGPWYHGQQIDPGDHLGALRFDADTSKQFRHEVLKPFLEQYLKDGAPPAGIAPVTAYQTGANRWQRLDSWLAPCPSGCAAVPQKLYLEAGHGLAFTVPTDADAYDDYVSDPAKPVPFRARPIQPIGYTAPMTWTQWLVDDQREASGRTDVLTYMTPPLDKAVTLAGSPVANIVASTTGTDGDFVVKLIDVYPDEVPSQPEMGGYQLPIAMDILRGRYRESLETPKAITPDTPLAFRFALPNVNHVFKPGHRIMVQIQSSWFPLYDRNPQTFVDNIFFAKPQDYRKATIKVFHAANQASFVELPVVPAN